MVQVGAFSNLQRAEQLCQAMEKIYGVAQMIPKPGAPPMWRVLVGREVSKAKAQSLAARVRRQTGVAMVISPGGLAWDGASCSAASGR